MELNYYETSFSIVYASKLFFYGDLFTTNFAIAVEIG